MIADTQKATFSATAHRRLTHWFSAILAAFLMFSLSPTQAAEPSQGLVARFDKTKAEAEVILRSPLGEHEFKKEQELDALRERLAGIRDRAQAIADAGTLDSRQVQARIDALGPPPGDDRSEPAYIANRRAALEEEQAKLFAPMMKYKEVQYQAASLVNDIDQRIDRLNNQHLFSQSFSPLDPRLWTKVVSDFRADPASGSADIAAPSPRQVGPMSWVLRVAGALALLAAGIALYNFVWSRTRRRIERTIQASNSVARRLTLILLEDAASATLFGFLLIIVTVFSILLFVGVARQDFLLSIGISIVLGGLFIAAAHWLGRSVLLSPIPELRLISFSEDVAAKAFMVVVGLGGILAFEAIFEMLEEAGFVPDSLVNLLSTLIIIAGGALIWRLANLIKVPTVHPANEENDEQPAASGPSSIDFSGTISRMMRALALVAITTALAGYMMLARDVFTGVLLSLAVIAIAVYAHRTVKLIVDGLVAGPLAQFRGVLRFVPLAAGFVLLLLGLFLIALVWGYRLQEIADALIMLRTGIEFGNIRLSAGDMFTFGLVFFVGFIVTRWVQRFLRLSLLPQFSIDHGAQAAIVTGVGYIGVMLAAVVAIASTGLDLTSLAFVFGALSVGIGFGLQSVVENFTSGILLLIERPIRVGDWIEVGDHSGVVKKIAVRSTQIETWDRHQIIIPNSQLISDAVKNLSLAADPARVTIPAGISYDSDIDAVKALLLDIAKGHEKVLDFPEPFVTLDAFADSSINLKLLVFVDDVTISGGVKSDLNFEIARRFADEGFEMPFPQRDLHIRSGFEAAISGRAD